MGIIKVTVKKKSEVIGYLKEQQANKLREIKPEFEVWKSSFNMNRRIGHTNLTLSFLMEGGTNHLCTTCNEHTTVSHSGGMPQIIFNMYSTIVALA